ncbi:MAG: GGDEF domain-containing protein, partial [Candidatus Omnitrophica bacterium]|nr:GGDEF domain-containing protein [Candidatus Omnitrophota bacterium]
MLSLILGIGVLAGLTLAIILLATRLAHQRLHAINQRYAVLEKEYTVLSIDTQKLFSQNKELELSLSETSALYEVTKELSKTLQEGELITIFKNCLERYLSVKDFQYIRGVPLSARYKELTTVPFVIQGDTVGHVAVRKIREQDRDNFEILVHQFFSAFRRAELYRKVQELSIIDGLTQVFSRRYLLQRGVEELQRSKEFALNLTLLMLDLDYFKTCNDRYGHLVGDAVLKEVAKRINHNIRQIDFVGRYGGEEFCVVLAETEKDQALFIAERLRRTVSATPIRAYDEELSVTISIGLAVFPSDAQEMDVLLEKADQALYSA